MAFEFEVEPKTLAEALKMQYEPNNEQINNNELAEALERRASTKKKGK